MVFHWSLSDSKSPQVSRILLNNAVVWMVSTRLPTSKSSSPFYNPLVTVPKAPITIGIIVTCMFHSFFQFPNKVQVLILLFPFFQFYSVISRDSKVDNFANSFFFFFSFFFFWFFIRSGLLAEIKWSVYMSKSHNLCVSFSRADAYYYYYYYYYYDFSLGDFYSSKHRKLKKIHF